MKRRRRALASFTEAQDQRESQETLDGREALLHIWGLKGLVNSPYPHWEHCWAWLTGRDLDGRPIIWTNDERDNRAPVKPFPDDKPYLRLLVEWALGEPKDMQLDKARQMMATTTLVLVADWMCRALPVRQVLLSKSTEGEATKIIREKLRQVHERLPPWVQEASPISAAPQDVVRYKVTKSTLSGVAQGFATRDARGSTASLVLVDEAAFQDGLKHILTAVMPMAARLWFFSTPHTGPGGVTFRDYLKGENETK